MARRPEKQNPDARRDDTFADDDDQSVIAEMARRALAMGLSGLFLTESTIRKAVGDTLPKEWSDFAVSQSERTRQEFLDRLTHEIGSALERVDVAAVLAELMSGRSLDITASIRLSDTDGKQQEEARPDHTFRVRLTGDDEER